MDSAQDAALKEIQEIEDKDFLIRLQKASMLNMLNEMKKAWKKLTKPQLIAALGQSEEKKDSLRNTIRAYEKVIDEQRGQLNKSSSTVQALQESLTRERRIVDALTK